MEITMKKMNLNKINWDKIKKNKLIDLVVPMYKAKTTLERLLASVLVQTMKDNMHIILVQDCDDEDYSDIILNFKNMLDIELIKLNENCGPGGCRRKGRHHGKSKYVMYMDADDTFHNPFAVQELYACIELGKFDAVNSIFIEQVDKLSFYSHDNNDWIWMFGKIYRRKFLEDNNIEMNDSRANEDTGFNSIINCVGNVGFLPDTTYIWHYKEDSITRKDGGIYRFTGIEGWLYNMQYAVDNMVRLNADKEKIKQFVADNIIATYIWFLEFGREVDERINVKEYKRWVNEYYKNIYVRYIPSEQQLDNAFCRQSQNTNFNSKIPEYTFEQYLKMVGEDYVE